MNKEKNFNPETVGTGIPLSKIMGIDNPKTKSKIFDALNEGKRVRLKDSSWYVFKQVPSTVPAAIIPKMSSLPEYVKKDLIQKNNDLVYTNQFCAVDENGNITAFHTKYITNDLDWEIID